MNNTIMEFLNLKDDEIESLNCHSTRTELVVLVSLKRRNLPCPKCQYPHTKVKDTHTRKINHGIFIDRKCVVHYQQKRYRCLVCNATFNEPCALVSKHQKKSLASHMQLMELLKNPSITFTEAGKLLHLSAQTVINSFYTNLPHYHPTLPQVLCIDEVYLGRNAVKKFVAVLLDFKTNQIVDIIYGRTKDALHSYFQLQSAESLNRVQYLSSDMVEGYRFLQRNYLKNAKLCMDSFHVIKLINDMFSNQLKILMKDYEDHSIEYYLLKHKRYLLLKNNANVKWYQQEYNHKLGYTVYFLRYRELLFDINPLIKELYDLKERYISFNKLNNPSMIQNELEALIQYFLSHPNKDVVRVGRTLVKWKSEILNSFTWFNGRRISNGPIESRNNTIKLLIRNAAGYHNFEHLSKRIIYCVNHSKKE